MYECFNCLQRAVIWDSDFDFEDYGYEGKGIIHECHCTNCGAMITYLVPINGLEDKDDRKPVQLSLFDEGDYHD